LSLCEFFLDMLQHALQEFVDALKVKHYDEEDKNERAQLRRAIKTLERLIRNNFEMPPRTPAPPFR